MPIHRTTKPVFCREPLPASRDAPGRGEKAPTMIAPVLIVLLRAAQVIEQLIELAREMRKAQGRGEKLGLTEDEVAFYDALETRSASSAATATRPTARSVLRSWSWSRPRCCAPRSRRREGGWLQG